MPATLPSSTLPAVMPRQEHRESIVSPHPDTRRCADARTGNPCSHRPSPFGASQDILRFIERTVPQAPFYPGLCCISSFARSPLLPAHPHARCLAFSALSNWLGLHRPGCEPQDTASRDTRMPRHFSSSPQPSATAHGAACRTARPASFRHLSSQPSPTRRPPLPQRHPHRNRPPTPATPRSPASAP